jgi:hypothetical protein
VTGGYLMPQNKEEIIRHVNELVTQIKNKTYKSPFNQSFAEVYIEDDKGTKTGEAISQNIEDKLSHPIDKNYEIFLEMRQLSRNIGFLTNPYNKLSILIL